jgi:hypothetical protein
MWGAGKLERRKFRKFPLEQAITTYFVGTVALESAVIDLHSALVHSNSSTLCIEVACPPPGIGAKKVQENSETRFCTTYIASAVALESAGVDLDICTVSSINSTALEVACPAPGIGAKI